MAQSNTQNFVARMLSGHSVVGLAVGALMYILCLSGTLMVFHEEIERWEQPAAPEFLTVSSEAAAKAASTKLSVAEEAPHHLYVGLPNADMPRLTVTLDEESWFADQQGNIAGSINHPWTDFLQELHYYLHLPKVLGLTVVGLLGVMLVGLVISGLLAHPKIFKDAFALRLSRNKQLREADIHNRLSVWGAPFHLVVALTGAVLGLASILSYFVATTYLQGDIESFYEPIFGDHPVADETPAPVSDIAAAIDNVRAEYPEAQPWYVIMDDPGTKGQGGYVLAKHQARLIYGENYYFDESGTLTGKLGHSDGTAAQQIVASAYTAHFGSFGGLPVKLIYGVLGLALTIVSAGGINIWLIKRRERGRAAPKLERMWAATVWGTPLAFTMCFVLAVLAGLESFALNISFWILLLAFVAAALGATNRDQVAGTLRLINGAAILGALVIYGAQNGMAVFNPAGLSLTLSLMIIAFAFLWFSPLAGKTDALAPQAAE